MRTVTLKLLASLLLATGLTGVSFGLLGISPPVSWAFFFTVTKFTDTNDGACNTDCSLREAIIDANASPGADTIVLNAGTYNLTIGGTGEDATTSGDLDITDDLTITGAGSGVTVIDAGGLIPGDRALHILTATVTISGVTIRNGNGVNAGGGIYQYNGTLTLNNSQLFSNTANYGGGLYVKAGGITLSSGQILSNTAGWNGEVYLWQADSVFTQTAGAIQGNTAITNGGGFLSAAATLPCSTGKSVTTRRMEPV
jgi:CSLREA domain-containing protein